MVSNVRERKIENDGDSNQRDVEKPSHERTKDFLFPFFLFDNFEEYCLKMNMLMTEALSALKNYNILLSKFYCSSFVYIYILKLKKKLVE